jgi:hypothetical protein
MKSQILFIASSSAMHGNVPLLLLVVVGLDFPVDDATGM